MGLEYFLMHLLSCYILLRVVIGAIGVCIVEAGLVSVDDKLGGINSLLFHHVDDCWGVCLYQCYKAPNSCRVH